MQQDNGNGLVIDRSRITHGESKRAALLEMEARRAQREEDVEALDRIISAADAMLMKVVVSVPDDWDVDLNDANWIDKLSQDKYEELTRMAQPQAPGEKKR